MLFFYENGGELKDTEFKAKVILLKKKPEDSDDLEDFDFEDKETENEDDIYSEEETTELNSEENSI